MEGFW